jgi:hypothetical protein
MALHQKLSVPPGFGAVKVDLFHFKRHKQIASV